MANRDKPPTEPRALRLWTARRATGLDQTDFIKKHGLEYHTYRAHERGKRNITEAMAQLYGPLVGVDWRYLLYGTESGAVPEAPEWRPMPIETGPEARDLPVYGRVVGGSDTWFEFNGERLDTLFRPHLLKGVKDAYAMFVDGDSMSPRYRAGETIYVHPGRPVRPGDCVVVLVRPKQDGEAHKALIKELVSKSGDHIILKSLNPPDAKPIKLPAESVVSLHRIVLGGEG